MTDFFYNDEFYSDLTELTDAEGWDFDDINELEDDFKIHVNDSSIEKIVNFSLEWLTNQLEGRFPESDLVYDQVSKIFTDNIDFDKINSLLPNIVIQSRKTFIITKGNLLEALK